MIAVISDQRYLYTQEDMGEYQKQIELLKLLRDATRSGRTKWHSAKDGSHSTKVVGMGCSLRFKHPLLAGDDGSDADAAELTANGMVLTFYAGTEGFNLVGEILEAAYPGIRVHNRQIAALLEEAIKRLRKQRGSVLTSRKAASRRT